MLGKGGMKVDAGMDRGWLQGRWQEYTRRIARDAKIRLHAAGAGIPIMSTNAAHSILLDDAYTRDFICVCISRRE